jgi:site-specific DNA-adenine methylase
MRYKGSKAWLAPLLGRLLPEVRTLISPFFGSGKVELALMRRPGLRILGSDAWAPLVALYAAALAHPAEVEARLAALQVPTREEYRALMAAESADPVAEAARVFQVLNSSFDGQWGKYVPRRPPATSALHRLLRDASARERLTVARRDVFEVLAELRPDESTALYLDPPYLLKRHLYPVADHSPAFHRRLAAALRECPVPFALSLNDCPEAHSLYGEWCRTLRPRARELLFLWPPAWWK